MKQRRFSMSTGLSFLIISALAGYGWFFLVFPKISTTARLHLQINRFEAEHIASDYISSQGYLVQRYSRRNTWFRIYNAQEAFYQEYHLSAVERARIDSFSTVAGWHVVFRHPEQNERFQVLVDPEGRVFNYLHILPPHIGHINLTQDEALILARRFLTEHQPVDWSQYDLCDVQTQKVESRTDYVFRWEQKMSGPGNIRLSLWATVKGDRVEGWNRHVKLPREFIDFFQSKTQPDDFLHIARFVLPWSIIFVALILFVRRYNAGEVSIRNALMFAMLTISVLAINSLNELAASEPLRMAYDIDNFDFQIFITYLNLAVQIIFLGLGTFLVWANGESMTHELWGEKLRNFDALFNFRFFCRDHGKSLLRGFILAGIYLGVFYLLAHVVTRFDEVWILSAVDHEQYMSSLIPFGTPILQGMMWTLVGLSWPLIFTWPLLKRLFRNVFIAGAITLLFFEISFCTLPIYSVGFRLAIVTISALVVYWFYWRYDLLSVGVGLFIIIVLETATNFALQPDPLFQWSGWGSYVGLGLLLLYGWISAVKGEEIDETRNIPEYVRNISEREQLKLELEIARRAQLRMLPQHIPVFPSLDIAACSEPAREVGGDYYDFVEYDPQRLGIVIGDVSGKGMPAALYMTLTKGFFLQAVSDLPAEPKQIVSKVNRNFFKAAEPNMFISLCYAIFDMNQKQMTYIRAGHTPLLLRKSADTSAEFLQPGGLAIGLEGGALFEKNLETTTIPIESGNTFVFYTDGLTEGRNGTLEEFGEARLQKIIEEDSAGSAIALLEQIRKTHSRFVGRHEVHDDLTCVVVKVV